MPETFWSAADCKAAAFTWIGIPSGLITVTLLPMLHDMITLIIIKVSFYRIIFLLMLKMSPYWQFLEDMNIKAIQFVYAYLLPNIPVAFWAARDCNALEFTWIGFPSGLITVTELPMF